MLTLCQKLVLRSTVHHRFSILSRHLADNPKVRVRFAPSPTGDLHLGGLRTALYNYLYARSLKGKFILRIEDTDQTRLVPGAAERLIDDLLWAGIEIDEGPGFGGVHAPYVQSKRAQLYTESVQKLIENGSAYRCFCSERRLDLIRKDAVRLRQVPRYDNKCRSLSVQQINENIQNNLGYCVRFQLKGNDDDESKQLILNDLIYGRVEHNTADNEGDPVIMKSDGMPTYHLANVVDDHLMEITHVLRGVEWQISTPKHIMMYHAFGWQPPQYGHLPLLINADGTKLSKRQGDIGIKYFRDKGYFPEAVVNYVTSAGGGFQRSQNSNATTTLHTLNELTQQFKLSCVNTSPSRLNPDVLNNLNRQELLRRLAQPALQTKLVEQVQTIVEHAYGKTANNNLDLENLHVVHVLQWAAQRLSVLSDLTSKQLSFLWVKPMLNPKEISSIISVDQLQRLLLLLTDDQQIYSKDALNAKLKSFCVEEKLKFAHLMKSLRSMLSGLQEGPAVAEMMQILGRRTVLLRLQDALNMITNYDATLKESQ